MALTPAYNPPGITIYNRQILHPTLHKRVIKAFLKPRRLRPRALRIPQEHAQQMPRTGLPGRRTAVRAPCVQDAQVVQELHVALFAVERGAEALGQALHRLQRVLLLGGHEGHACVAREERGPLERGFDELAHGLVVREEEGGA